MRISGNHARLAGLFGRWAYASLAKDVRRPPLNPDVGPDRVIGDQNQGGRSVGDNGFVDCRRLHG